MAYQPPAYAIFNGVSSQIELSLDWRSDASFLAMPSAWTLSGWFRTDDAAQAAPLWRQAGADSAHDLAVRLQDSSLTAELFGQTLVLEGLQADSWYQWVLRRGLAPGAEHYSSWGLDNTRRIISERLVYAPQTFLANTEGSLHFYTGQLPVDEGALLLARHAAQFTAGVRARWDGLELREQVLLSLNDPDAQFGWELRMTAAGAWQAAVRWNTSWHVITGSQAEAYRWTTLALTFNAETGLLAFAVDDYPPQEQQLTLTGVAPAVSATGTLRLGSGGVTALAERSFSGHLHEFFVLSEAVAPEDLFSTDRLTPRSQEPISVDQPPGGGDDYPFRETHPAGALVADIYLAYAAPEQPYELPLRIDWVHGFNLADEDQRDLIEAAAAMQAPYSDFEIVQRLTLDPPQLAPSGAFADDSTTGADRLALPPSCIELDGTGHLAPTLQRHPLAGAVACTFSGYVKLLSYTAGALLTGDTLAAAQKVELAITNTGQLSLTLGTSATVLAPPESALTLNTWHHVSCTLRQISGTVDAALYLDGRVVHTAAVLNTVLEDCWPAQLQLGNSLHARLQDVQLYRVAYPPGYIGALSDPAVFLEPVESELAALYPLEERVGAFAADISAAGLSLYHLGGVTHVADGVRCRANEAGYAELALADELLSIDPPQDNLELQTTHPQEMLIVDAADRVVCDTRRADLFEAQNWGQRLRVLQWVNATDRQVLRAVVRLLDDADQPITAIPEHWALQDAWLDARTADATSTLVTSLQIEHRSFSSEAFLGDIVLKAGNNMRLETSIDDSLLRPVTVIDIDAVSGAGTGKYKEECEDFAYTIRRINGTPADPSGNWTLTAGDCYRAMPVGKVITAGNFLQWDLLNQLWLSNDCSVCCSCQDYLGTYEAVRQVKAKYQAALTRAQALKTTYLSQLARLDAQRTCLISHPLTLFTRKVPPTGLIVMVAICNHTDECWDNLLAVISFEYDDGVQAFQTVVLGAPPELETGTIMRSGNVYLTSGSRTQEPQVPEMYQIGGSWPHYYAGWGRVSARSTASLTFRLDFASPLEDGQVELMADAFRGVTVEADLHAPLGLENPLGELYVPGEGPAAALLPLRVVPHIELAQATLP